MEISKTIINFATPENRESEIYILKIGDMKI